jgi:hypothetical protein
MAQGPESLEQPSLSTMRKTEQIAHFAVCEHKRDTAFNSSYVDEEH